MHHTTEYQDLQSSCDVRNTLLNITAMDRWKEQLSKKGMLLSKQRLLIMEALFHEPVFEDIEAIWMELRIVHQVSWAAFYSFIRVAIKEKWIIKYGDKINNSRFELRIN